MISSKFLTTSAIHLAATVQKLSGEDPTSALRIENAYWLTFSRPPTAPEIESSSAYLTHLAKIYRESGSKPVEAAKRAFENFVHMLQCSNEFLYVD
jgi:hypothetical protein